MKAKSLILILVTLLFSIALSIPASGQMGIAYPYFLSSANEAYYLKSIPHASQMYFEIGRTEVYRSVDSLMIYKIDKYLAPDGVVLSNDGQSILYARSEMTLSSIDSSAVLVLFRNGRVVKSYHYTDLLEEDRESFYQGLFYFDQNNYTYENDTVRLVDNLPEHLRTVSKIWLSSNGVNAFIAARDSTVLLIDLKDGDLIDRIPFEEAAQFILNNFTNRNIAKPEFHFPGTSSMPDMADGSSFDSAVSEHIDMAYDGVIRNDRYRYYHLEIGALIDSDGNCIEAEVTFEESTKQLEILEFVLNQKYDAHAVPDIIEKWNFSYSTRFRKLDTVVAAQEAKDYHLWRIQQDTLDGVYIPKDIEDCMNTLDQILSDEEKARFRKQDPIDQHFGLGLYIRNNWGLWSSSRFKVYMKGFGLSHPDNISGIVLDCYHAHLRGNPINFENRISSYPKEKTIERKLMPPSELKFPFQDSE